MHATVTHLLRKSNTKNAYKTALIRIAFDPLEGPIFEDGALNRSNKTKIIKFYFRFLLE